MDGKLRYNIYGGKLTIFAQIDLPPAPFSPPVRHHI